jgi:hypothetical protein
MAELADLTPIKLDLDWTPKSVALTYSVGGNTYPPLKQVDAVTRASDSRYQAFTTPINTPLTFTATATLPTGLVIVEYKWDFGDGTIGFGATVAHQYLAANYATQVALNVLMSNGKRFTRHKILNLRPADRITVSMQSLIAPGATLALMTSPTRTTTPTLQTHA